MNKTSAKELSLSSVDITPERLEWLSKLLWDTYYGDIDLTILVSEPQLKQMASWADRDVLSDGYRTSYLIIKVKIDKRLEQFYDK